MRETSSLDRFRALRVLVTIIGLPLALLSLIVAFFGILISSPLLVTLAITLLYFVGIGYNVVYFQTLNSDQLTSLRNYYRPIIVLAVLLFLILAGSLWFSAQYAQFTFEKSMFFVISTTLIASFFGFRLPLAIQRTRLGLDYSQREFRAQILHAGDLRSALGDLTYHAKRYDEEAWRHYLSETHAFMTNLVMDEYTYSTIEASSRIYDSIWLIGPIIAFAILYIVHLIRL